jgi:serine/threonine protein kinase
MSAHIGPDSLVLGRYRVLFAVDERRLVHAYLARDNHSDAADAPVLIKRFAFDLRSDPGAAARLLEELRELEQLRDPGVVALLGHEVIDHRLVTVQEHSPGVSLFDLCELSRRQQKRLPVDVAIYVVRRLLSTLHRCHTRTGRAFVHGRVNLGCIMLPRSGEPQISDFCLARLTDEAAEAESNVGFFQTRISYMAPELPHGHEPTPAADTYALGLVLYRLLSDENPLRGRSAGETLQRVLRQVPEPLSIPSWSGCDRANEIFARALAKNPLDRYQSCEELWRDLTPLQEGSDEALAAELSAIVQDSGADWGRANVLANSSREPKRPEYVESPRPAVLPYFDSSTPAFASGLLTDQPKSATEHTKRERQARGQRRALYSLTVAALATGAAVLAGGLMLLTRERADGIDGAVAPAAAASKLADPLESDLRAQLQPCKEEARRVAGGLELELEFDGAGVLVQVRLEPPEMVNTRLGACLLEAAWRANPKAPGAQSMVLDPAE